MSRLPTMSPTLRLTAITNSLTYLASKIRISYVAQTLIVYIDRGMPVEVIVAKPRHINRFGTYNIEASTRGKI